MWHKPGSFPVMCESCYHLWYFQNLPVSYITNWLLKKIVWGMVLKLKSELTSGSEAESVMRKNDEGVNM
jgi:hypothetical protein